MQYAASADNQTDKKIAALVVPTEGIIYEADMDAARGTTTGSNVVGYYIDILTTNAAYLDESTASATSANYMIIKNHESSTTKTYVVEVERQTAN